MFRKVSKKSSNKRKQHNRKRTTTTSEKDDDNDKRTKASDNKKDDDDEAEEEEESESTIRSNIQMTKKKRKLLNSVQYRRGLDSKETLVASSKMHQPQAPSSSLDATAPAAGEVGGEPSTEEDGNRTDMSENGAATTDYGSNPDRVRTFGLGTTKGGDAPEGGVLERKHRQAMEEFVQQHHSQMKQSKSDTDTETTTATTLKDLQAKLYQEISAMAADLSGSTTKAITASKSNNQDGESKEVDVGSGGTMLAGTGLAEVILPVDSRIKTAQETEAARRRQQLQQSGPSPSSSSSLLPISSSSMLPTSFAPGRGKRARQQKQQRPDLTTTGADNENSTSSFSSHIEVSNNNNQKVSLPSSVSQNFSRHAYEKRQRQRQLEQHSAIKSSGTGSYDGDYDRVGFASRFEQKQPPQRTLDGTRDDRHHNHNNSNRAPSDTRVFREFVKHQRERGF